MRIERFSNWLDGGARPFCGVLVWDLKAIAAGSMSSSRRCGGELTARTVTSVAEKVFCNWQMRHSLQPN